MRAYVGVGTNLGGEAVFGWTCLDDVTARDIQRAAEGHCTRSKSFDTFCPIGPVVETDLDPLEAVVTCRVNGRSASAGSRRTWWWTRCASSPSSRRS